MGADGWLGIGWPKEYGGQDRSPIEQFIFFDEAQRAGAPVPLLTINTVGPTIMQFGTEEQKDFFLPGILRGELALRHRLHRARARAPTWRRSRRRPCATATSTSSTARRSSRAWPSTPTTCGSRCAPTRTCPKHKGISIIIVPTSTPGLQLTPIHIIGGGRTNATFYDDVRVPVANRVGGENEGWELIDNPAQPRARRAVRRRARRPARSTRCTGGRGDDARRRTRVIDQQWVQLEPGPGAGRARVPPAHELEDGVGADRAARLDPGRRVGHQGVRHRALHARPTGCCSRSSGRARLPQARLARGACCGAGSSAPTQGTLILTFGGGTNEVQRDIIAMFGLGMPRAPLASCRSQQRWSGGGQPCDWGSLAEGCRGVVGCCSSRAAGPSASARCALVS